MFDKVKDEWHKANQIQKAKEEDNTKKKSVNDAKTLKESEFDIDYTSIDKLRENNRKSILNIIKDQKLGSPVAARVLTLDLKEQTKITLLNTLVNQNWVMIRQNEVIIRLLEKQNGKHQYNSEKS